ncbi:probable 60S ribosomal protein L14 [Rhodamnia argentea]|uniref:Probable 60S ribosomal protein L14 n=1 Tax=Rhodamnia argentea TaxID=178133 RepID=A0A8B8QNF4_9MYRT|nr:probable 60S ribosomal protein L14 [Rhodamnia argentea]
MRRGKSPRIERLRIVHRDRHHAIKTGNPNPSAVQSLLFIFIPSLSADLCTHSRAPGKMPFKRYIEIGRVALINYGKDYGRLVVIVDVVDQNRALVDAPDMVRSQMNFKRLSLTDIKIDIKRVPRKSALIKAMQEADVQGKWDKSSWGRKLIVQKKRASLNDFDRFKLMLAKIKRGSLIRQELAKLKKESAS